MKHIYTLLALSVCLSASSQLVVNVTFIVDMSNETVSGNGVHLYGSMQGFNPAGTPMADQGNGKYQATVGVDPSTTYSYLFVNGNTLADLETVPAPCDTGIGGLRAFVSPASGTLTLGPFCYESCDPCPGVPADMTFQVDMSKETVSGNGVHLAATFNSFSPSATQMTDQGNGIYAHTESLFEGDTVEYAFVNGNTGGDMETVPNPCAVGQYRQAVVPTGGGTSSLVCFESCDTCVVLGVDPISATAPMRIVQNRTSDYTYLLMFLPQAEAVSYDVYDIAGRLIESVELGVLSGKHEAQLDLRHVPSGLVTVRAKAGATVVSQSVIVTR